MSANEGRIYRHPGLDDLTPAEIAVLTHTAAGMTDRETGVITFTSESTAKRHMRNILSKLDARSRSHAVAIAFRKGILK